MPISSGESSILRDTRAVSEIFWHLDADNAVSETLSLHECDFYTKMFSKRIRYPFVVDG